MKVIKVKDCCADATTVRKLVSIDKMIFIYDTEEEAIKALDPNNEMELKPAPLMTKSNWFLHKNQKWIEMVGGNENYTVLAAIADIHNRVCLGIVGYREKQPIEEKEITIYITEEECIKALEAEGLPFVSPVIRREVQPKKWIENMGGNDEYIILGIFENSKCINKAGFKVEE